MANLAKKSSFGTLKPINEELGSSQSRHFRNNFSEIASYIDKKDSSFDSGYDFVDQLKKYGFETVNIDEDSPNSQKKVEEDASQLNPYFAKLARSTGAEDNFLDFSNLMKMRQEQAKSLRTDKSFANAEKLQDLKQKIQELSKKMKIERKETEIALLEFQQYQAELVEETYEAIRNLMIEAAWQFDKKLEKEKEKQKIKWQKQVKKLEEQNKENRQKLYESNFLIKQHQQKIKSTERLLENAQEEIKYYKKQIQQLKSKQKQLESINKKSINKFQIPKTDIDYSFCQIEIEHLKIALADLQRENSCLKLALETKAVEYEQYNEIQQNQEREIDKTRYLNMIQKFQEEIEILEQQINQLRLKEKEKSERIRNWERDFEEQQHQLERTIDQCEKKERYLRDLERKLKMREEALLMREEILESSELTVQRDRMNYSPQKHFEYQPRTPRIRQQMSSPISNMGYYSPKLKSTALWNQIQDRTPTNVNSSNRTYFHGGADKKYFQKDMRINSRIEKIQNSLNRELSNLSRRF